LDVLIDLSDTYFGWQRVRRQLGLSIASLDYLRLVSLVANTEDTKVTGISASVSGSRQRQFHHTLVRAGWTLHLLGSRRRAWPVELSFLLGALQTKPTKELILVSSGSKLSYIPALVGDDMRLTLAFFRGGIDDLFAKEIVQKTVDFFDLTPHVHELQLRANHA